MKGAIGFTWLLAMSLALGQTGPAADQLRASKRPLAGAVVVLPTGQLVVADVDTNLVVVQVAGRWKLQALAQSCNLPTKDLTVCAAGSTCGPKFTTTKLVGNCNGMSFFQVHLNGVLQEEGYDYATAVVAGKTEVTFLVPLPKEGDVRVRIDYQTPGSAN